MTTLTGYVPEKLKYVQRPAKEIVPYREGDWWEPVKDSEKVFLRETFVVDATNPKTLETAKRWAAGYNGQNNSGVTITERDNLPIGVLEVITLEVRAEGGRAWKVLVDGMYYVDLREDTLLEALRAPTGGVAKGELRGPFVWAVMGSQMKLVLVGSHQHKAVVEAGKRRNTKAIPQRELEVGGVYQTVRGEKYLFLGLWDSEQFDVEWDNREYYGERGTPRDLTLCQVPKQELWLEVSRYWKNGLADFWAPQPTEVNGVPRYYLQNTHYLEIVKAKKVVTLVEKVTLPENLEAALQAKILEDATYAFNYEKDRHTNNKTATTKSDWSNMLYHCQKLRLRPHKAARPPVPACLVPLYERHTQLGGKSK